MPLEFISGDFLMAQSGIEVFHEALHMLEYIFMGNNLADNVEIFC